MFSVIRLSILFCLLTYLTACGGGSGNFGSSKQLVTDEEYAVVKAAPLYLTDQADQIESQKLIEKVEDFLSVSENLADAADCTMLSIKEIKSLVYSDDRSKWLRQKGFHYFAHNTPLSGKIAPSAAEVSAEDNIYYGRCRSEAKKEVKARGGRAGLITAILDENIGQKIKNFKQQVMLENLDHSGVSFMLKGDYSEALCKRYETALK